MDRLLAFETLVAAIEEGGISSAANRLGTTKSNVSRRLAELEAHLGVRLLNRNSRRLTPTPAGDEVYAEAKRLLNEVGALEERVMDRLDAPRGRMRITVSMSFATLHLKAVLVSLVERYPGLLLDLNMDDQVLDLAEHGFDCAVRLGRLADSSLVARQVAPNRHVICASPEYLARRGTPNGPEELKDHDGLHYSFREPNNMWRLEHGGGAASYRVNFRMRCNNGEVLQEAALRGLGLAILPTYMASPHIRDGALRVVLPDHVPPGGSIAVVYHRERQTSAKLRVLIDALLAAYGPVPPWDRDIAHLLPPQDAQRSRGQQPDEVA